MRIIVFFDLPSETAPDMREYRRFRKLLIRNGFVMMQESVYSKIVLNTTTANVIMDRIRKNKTSNGLIQALIITERQFERMEVIVGDTQNIVIDNDSRLVVL